MNLIICSPVAMCVSLTASIAGGRGYTHRNSGDMVAGIEPVAQIVKVNSDWKYKSEVVST
ncbi:MAG: hypothetical protein KIH69_012930 [Anaerolineae bacterium]|nr:hypothetical protein [Anaerolineae bacterium]